MLRNPILLLVPFVAACATPEGEYPSLAIRDAERIGGSFEPVASEPYVPPPTSGAVLDRLGELAGEAASAHRAFLAEAPGVRGAVSAARGVGSEAWARAQVALAGLQASRSRAVIALADIDRIYVDAATEGGETERIAAARDAVANQVEEQNRVIESLIGNLPR
jgi:hypothetical protein